MGQMSLISQIVLPGLDLIFPAFCFLLISTITGLVAILLAVFREFKSAASFGAFCIAISIAPGIFFHVRAGPSAWFDLYSTLYFPSLFGSFALIICLLHPDYRNSIRFSIVTLISWVALVSIILAISSMLLSN